MGLPLLFASCANTDDLYDPAKADALLKAEYSANFIAKYGEIAPNQSWDATVSYSKYNTSTRGITSSGRYIVESSTLKWLNDNLPEGKNNSTKGTPFEMTVPANKFTIVPIYQYAKQVWSLWIKVGNDEPYKVWTKSEGLQYRNDSYDWPWKNVSEISEGSTKDLSIVRAPKYEFDYSDRAGEPMWLYLLIEEGLGNCANKGDKLWSDEGQMIALDMGNKKPDIDGAEVKVIACEDSYLSAVDHDMNDVVFLMYGKPEVPDITPTPEYRTTTTAKRYMIEDLGSTDDFDFNDIVVDVEQVLKEKLIKGEHQLSHWEEVSKTQTATIRHLGGVLPFTLKIGNTEFKEMEGQMDVDPNEEYEIAGWDPVKNNISIKVRDKKGGVHATVFPKDGEVPQIIAVKPSVQWMQERVSITKDWFESAKK